MKKCSTSLIIREMHIKTTLRQPLPPGRMAVINKSTKQQALRMRRKGNPCALLVGMQIGTATVENRIETFPKIKDKTTIWPSYSTSGNLSEANKNTNLNRYMHPCVHCTIMYNSQETEAAWIFIERWMGKKDVIRIISGILLSHKKCRHLQQHGWT